MSASILNGVPLAPPDPILGITDSFNADTNPKKVNLGVGVYYGDDGKVPLLECVRRAEADRLKAAPARAYLPIDGIPAYDKAVRELIFGAAEPAVTEERVVTVQAIGGTGGLKIGADFLRSINARAKVLISDPSWENHRALFENAGFTVEAYPYFDSQTHGVRFDAMLDALGKQAAGTIVLLHACCHNPTGVDLSPAQWEQVLKVVRNKELVPFLDMAYQGFAEGLEPDAHAVRLFAGSSPTLVSSSFSKSFSLYGERVGALSVVTQSAEEAARVLSQLKRQIRANYSNPPTHGGQVVAAVLSTPELRTLWDSELKTMRERILAMRAQLVEKIRARAPQANFEFVLSQRGMFSFSGLSKAQVAKLRTEHSVYAIDSGRICIAALNSRNIDYVADAIAKVL